MNYRTLLIISVLTLIVGIGGIMFMPTEGESNGEQQQLVSQPEPEAEKKPEKLILIAELKNDVEKGHLLQADDYILNEISVVEDSPLVSSDLKGIIDINSVQGLQGYLVAENMKAGSLLSSKAIISPNDSRFYTSSLDPNQDIAYRIYLRQGEDYILNTITGGNRVAVYSQQISSDSRNPYDRKNLVKLSENVLVLQVKRFNDLTGSLPYLEEGQPNNREYGGYIALKVTAEQAKNFYSLDRESKLVVLPAENNTQDIDSRGVFIRKLRGQ